MADVTTGPPWLRNILQGGFGTGGDILMPGDINPATDQKIPMPPGGIGGVPSFSQPVTAPAPTTPAATSMPMINKIPPLSPRSEAYLTSQLPNAGEIRKGELERAIPQVTATPGQVGYGEQLKAKLDAEKLNPWGSELNHPGTFGKIGHVLGRVGNIAGDVLIPRVMENIPGTDLNKQLQATQAAHWINLGSQVGERGAQQANLESETQKRDQPEKPKTPFEAYEAGEDIQPWIDLNAKEAQQKPESTDQALAGAISDAQKRGVDPSIDPKVQQIIKARTAEKPAKEMNPKEALQSQLAGELAKPTPDRALIKNLQDRMRAIDPLAEDRIRDAENRAAAAASRSENKTDLSTREKVLTYYKPAQDADVRLQLMEKNYQDAMKGDQQAMVNLLANHVAMTMGVPRGKVPRISHEMFLEAQQSAPILQRAEAHFDRDGYLTGVVLTPAQMGAMVHLAHETRDAEWQSAHSSADYIGVDKADRPKSIYGGEPGAAGGGGIPDGTTGTWQGKPVVRQGGKWVLVQ